MIDKVVLVIINFLVLMIDRQFVLQLTVGALGKLLDFPVFAQAIADHN